MARTGFFHHIGTFMLLLATVLLIITCISAPVVHNIGIMKVDLGGRNSNNGQVVFGTFGYCINRDSGNNCSPSHVGYSPADVMGQAENTQFSEAADSSTHALTKAMVLHPIACGVNFIAFLLALGAGVVGSLLAAIVAFFAFLITAAVLIIDFVLFSIVRSNIHDDGSGSDPYYAEAAWTMLVSGICSLLGTIILFFTCCSGRMHRNRRVDKAEVGYGAPATVGPTAPIAAPRRRRYFW